MLVLTRKTGQEIIIDGNIRITGRLKDIIIRNAENISAAEVEDVLLRHPDIADAAVVGLPDPATGERVCAVVVLRAGATCALSDVSGHCRSAGLAAYKVPAQLEVVDAIQRNAMGEVLKQQLRDTLAAGRSLG